MFDESAFAGMDIDAGLGSSPDGLGAHATPAEPTYAMAAVPAHPSYGTRMSPMPAYQQAAADGGVLRGTPMAGKATWLEPDDVSSNANVRSAGLSFLFLVVSCSAGVAIGGPWGAAAGLLLAGTTMNTYRAQKWWASTDPSQRYEAVTSAVFAAGGLAIGGYAAYKAYKARQGDSK